MLIGYLSPMNPFKDRKAWSGTYFNTRKALEKAGHQVEWVSYRNGSLMDKLCSKAYRLVYGHGSYTHSRLASKLRVRSIKQDLSKYDLLFVPGQVDIVAGLNTSTPIIYYTDGTVPLMIGYYWFGFSNRAVKEAIAIEQKAINNASYVWLSSQWAADSVINDYHAESKKVSVFPFGAALDDDKIVQPSQYDGQVLKIMFSGVDWVRKGGQIAVDAVESLNKRGINSELLICGIDALPNNLKNKAFIKNKGFLNKNNPEDLKKYLEAWQQANLLILPTRAECSAIVFSEAAAYGIPVITTDTGGIGTYVLNDVNGERLPLSANGKDYADVIEKWVKDKKLEKYSKGAKELYIKNISWDAWGKHFNEMFKIN